MKTIGQLLVWVSLAVGALAAATGYLASLDETDKQLLDLTLAAPAGKIENPDGKSQPIANKDDTVSAELLAELRSAGVENVRVKEFSLRRWRGKWFFLLSLAGLLAGGLITRFAAAPQRAAETDTDRTDTPERAIEALQATLEQLRADLPGMSDASARLDAIVDRIGQLQKTHMVTFVDARPTLVAMLGLSGYAGLMDSYAAAEREINRAWSAAVDKAYEEATACLDRAVTLIESTRQILSTARVGEQVDSG